MKTPAEWLKEIKHASDTEIRHGSSVFLTEEDIRKIQDDVMDEIMDRGLIEYNP